MLTYSNISLSVNILKSMVRVIRLMIRKSKSGKKYYRITIPIANEVFEKAGFDLKDEFGLEAREGKIIIKKR